MRDGDHMETREERRARWRKERMARLLANDDALALIREILEETGIFRISMTGNSQTFFREGQRAIGLWLLNEIYEAAPDRLAGVIVFTKQEEEDGRDRNDRSDG